MDFKQLEAFIKTVELSSFSQAGEVLYLSQPSISHHINNLEKELDVKLIMRTTKEVKPTKNGRVFYEYAKNIISLKDKAVFSVKNRNKPFGGEIEIHASSVPAQYILPGILVGFNRLYPDISYNIIMSCSENVVNDVLLQKCDIGIVGAIYESQKCNYRFLVSENLVLAAPPGSRISEENLAENIYNENFIMRESGSATRYHTVEYLKRLNILPEKLNIVAQLSNSQSILNAVSKGLGISIVSEIAAREYAKQNLITVVKFGKISYKRDFYFVTKKDSALSEAAGLLIDYVSENYKSEVNLA